MSKKMTKKYLHISFKYKTKRVQPKQDKPTLYYINMLRLYLNEEICRKFAPSNVKLML